MKGSWFASGCLILFLTGEGTVQRHENGEDLMNLPNTKLKVWVIYPTEILVSAQTAKTQICRAWAFIHLFPKKNRIRWNSVALWVIRQQTAAEQWWRPCCLVDNTRCRLFTCLACCPKKMPSKRWKIPNERGTGIVSFSKVRILTWIHVRVPLGMLRSVHFDTALLIWAI